MSYDDGLRKEHDDIVRLLGARYQALRDARREVEQLRRALVEGNGWRRAAHRVGEAMASNGPRGYGTFTPEEWTQWALAQLVEMGNVVGEMLDATSPAEEHRQQVPPDAAPVKGEGQHPRDRYRCCHCGEPPRRTQRGRSWA